MPFALAAVIALASAAVADDCLISLDAVAAPSPQFADYPAGAPFTGKPAPVELKANPEARQFSTQIRSDARAGPNFAGHFTVVGWGCGSACLDWGVVDAASGKVVFDPQIRIVTVDHVGEERAPIQGVNGDFFNLRFRLDSRLIVVLGAPGEDQGREGVAFYSFDGARFTLLKFVPRQEACRTG